jgi:MFS family permease
MNLFIDFSLFKKNTDFALIYSGQFISFLGVMATGVALPYQIYHITGSTLMVGILSLVQILPLIITALLGGVFADRYDRKRLLLGSEFLLAIGCIILAINAASSHPSILALFIIASIMSAISGLHRPAFDSIIQQIILKDDYVRIGILASFKYSFCMIVGPALAGLIIAHYGIVITFIADIFTYVISLLCILMMSAIPKSVHTEQISILHSLKEGLVFARSKHELLGSYFVDFIAMVFAVPNALFPAIAHNFGGVQTLGFLYSAPAVGSLLISFFSGWTVNVRHAGRAIAIAAALWGAAIIGFGFSHSLWVALFFLACSGAFDAISGIFRSTLWNSTIPYAYRGRLSGIEMISYISGPKLGDTRAGIAAAYLGMPIALVSGGVLCMIGVMVCCYLLPRFWDYEID